MPFKNESQKCYHYEFDVFSVAFDFVLFQERDTNLLSDLNFFVRSCNTLLQNNSSLSQSISCCTVLFYGMTAKNAFLLYKELNLYSTKLGRRI